MNETIDVSRNDFSGMVREFIRRIQDENAQEVLSSAILLDLTLDADNAADVLGLSEAGIRGAGEGIRAAYRAYQRGDRAQAAEIAGAVLAVVLGSSAHPDEPLALPPSTTLSLVRAPDGNYWIRVLNDGVEPVAKREAGARTVGPLRRNQVCHALILLGMKDRQADALIEKVDIAGTVQIGGVHEPAAP